MNRVRLIYDGISEIVGGNGLAVIVLADAGRKRALSIVCDEVMKLQLCSRMSEPARHGGMCIEVMWKMISEYTDTSRFEIMIHDVIEGEYKTTVINIDTLKSYRIRLSDAVLLSLISDIPIYVDESLMQKQGTLYAGNSSRMSIPINSITTDRLKEELDKAIKEENYRLASVIKEELNNRN